MQNVAGGTLRPSWAGIGAAHFHVSNDERYRGERALALARVFVAVWIATAAFLDPLRDPGPSFVAPVLGAYVVVALAVLILLLVKPARWRMMTPTVHAVDLSIAAVAMLAPDPRTPVWMLGLFALLAAAHRWGLREAIATAAAVIVLLLTLAVAVTMTQGHFSLGQLTGAVGLRRVIVANTLFLLAGVFLAYLAQAEKQFRAEAAALRDVVSRVELRSGLRNTMAAAFDALLRLADADRAILVVREIPTGRVALWEGGRITSASSSSVRVSLIDPRSLEHYMFAPDAAAWYAVRRRAQRDRLDIIALTEDGSRSKRAPRSLPDHLLEVVGAFRGLMGIGFELPGELKGRLFLVNPQLDSDRESSLAFGQRMVRHVAPAVHNVYLLHRLRSRSTANERTRLARELHDGIVQSVLGVQIQLHALSVQAAETSEPLASELNRLGMLLREETASLRDMMHGMTPPELPPEHLMDTLADVVQRFQRDTGISGRFITPLDRLDLSPRACREVTRIVHEGLVNVRKHSGARNVVVRLNQVDGVCELSIEDDGRGFPYAGRRALDMEQAHQSLWTIRERVRGLGGQVTVESDPGHGARIEIALPVATATYASL